MATTQRVKYASVGRRAAALLIDFLVWYLFVMIVVNLTGLYRGYSPLGYLMAVEPAWTLVFVLIGFVYFIVLERVYGRTVGKLAAGIVVRRPGGDDIGWGQSVVRNLMRIVDGFPYLLPYCVGWVAAFNSVDVRRLGDMAANTDVVVREPEFAFRATGKRAPGVE